MGKMTYAVRLKVFENMNVAAVTTVDLFLSL